MYKLGKVLLIVGPAGSGKSTLALYAAKKLQWELVEEDRYWVEHEWGSGMRTEEQEVLIQSEVSEHIIELCKLGRNVVIEFILYKNPPNPLTNYVKLLAQSGIEYSVVALQPSLETIMERQIRRGRVSDIENAIENRVHAQHQIDCLNEDYIKDSVIDTSNLSVEDTFEIVAKKL
jgi:adenylate kinase family enzyme